MADEVGESCVQCLFYWALVISTVFPLCLFTEITLSWNCKTGEFSAADQRQEDSFAFRTMQWERQWPDRHSEHAETQKHIKFCQWGGRNQEQDCEHFNEMSESREEGYREEGIARQFFIYVVSRLLEILGMRLYFFPNKSSIAIHYM